MSGNAAKSEVEGVPESRLRLFCALDPPEPVVNAITSWQRGQEGVSERLRPVRPDSLHMTVAFLGDQPEAEVDAIAGVVEGIEPRPIPARLRVEPVPVPRRRPRLFALEAESPAAEQLAGELGDELTALGVFRRPKRPFWPHLTVFRVRGRAEAGRPAGRLDPLPGGDGHAFGFVRLALYRSELRPEGSKYSRLAARHLPQSGGPQEEVN